LFIGESLPSVEDLDKQFSNSFMVCKGDSFTY